MIKKRPKPKKRKSTLKRFFERFEQNGLTINRFIADCGSCSEEIVEEIEKIL